MPASPFSDISPQGLYGLLVRKSWALSIIGVTAAGHAVLCFADTTAAGLALLCRTEFSAAARALRKLCNNERLIPAETVEPQAERFQGFSQQTGHLPLVK